MLCYTGLCFAELYWAVLYWVGWLVLSCTGLCWSMKDDTELCCAVLGWAGLYWAMLVAGLGLIAPCRASAAARGPSCTGWQKQGAGAEVS